MADRRETIEVPLPEHVSVEQGADGLVLSHRWFRPIYIFMAFFCVFWDGFLIAWYFGIPTQGAPRPASFYWFPLLHVGAGLWLTYYTIAGFLNRTLIGVNQGEITIRHTPLPWLGGRRIQAGELKQLYCEEIHGRRSQTTFQLCAVRKDGTKLKLLTGLPGSDVALLLEERIERQLGIQDRHVPGELSK
jgi:hypothetical protein